MDKNMKCGDTLCLFLCHLRFFLCLCSKLRAASEYEERKMIRAAIRHVREEQQQGEFSCVTTWTQTLSVCLYSDATFQGKMMYRNVHLFAKCQGKEKYNNLDVTPL